MEGRYNAARAISRWSSSGIGKRLNLLGYQFRPGRLIVKLFAGIEAERFYFVHSYAAQDWTLHPVGSFAVVAPIVTWATHGTDFVAAVENGPLCATQFHPEKSGDAGAHLLENWVRSVTSW